MLLLILIILILGGFGGGFALNAPYHYGSFGLGGILLIVLLVLALSGRL